MDTDLLKFIGIFVLITVLVVCVPIYFTSKVEVDIFNKEYKTSYKVWQWVCGSETIKQIIQGTKHNITIK